MLLNSLSLVTQILGLLMEHSSQVVQTFIAIMNKSFHIKRIILLLCINYHYQYNMGDAVGAPVNEETVGHLRQRLNVMRDIVKVGQDSLFSLTSNSTSGR